MIFFTKKTFPGSKVFVINPDAWDHLLGIPRFFLRKGSSETPKSGAITCGKEKLYFQASILVIDAFLV